MLLDPPTGAGLTAAEAADLITDAASPGSPLPQPDEPFRSIPGTFAAARAEFFGSIASNGLNSLSALAYVEAYEAAITRLVAERVPDAAPDPFIEEFASMDVIEMGPRSLMQISEPPLPEVHRAARAPAGGDQTVRSPDRGRE